MDRETAVMNDLAASVGFISQPGGSIVLLDATGAPRLTLSPATAVAE